jgi:hypothetical protein
MMVTGALAGPFTMAGSIVRSRGVWAPHAAATSSGKSDAPHMV